jgi:hypothetical protein
MAARKKVPVDVKEDEAFDKAFALLAELVDLSEADERHPVRGNAVYTTSVVLWMLVYQRMSPDSSLEAAVKALIEAQPACLPENKRVREGTLSTNTSSYAQARSRLPVEMARWFAGRISQSLIDTTTPAYGQRRKRRVFMIDGTTITLAPEPALQQAYPPASNQHGEGVWPVALLTMAHELSSGAALVPQVGAKYGPEAVSEMKLAHRCIAELPPHSIVLADAAYGIFSFAWAAHAAGQSFVLRMTSKRFEALRRKAVLLSEQNIKKGQKGRKKQAIPAEVSAYQYQTYTLAWSPSDEERKANPDLPGDAVLQVRLHEIVINKQLTLLLVTDLNDNDDSASALADLYELRTHMEIDIRNFKIVLDAEHIRARSVEMFHKELLLSNVSYNLVSQFRRQAAAIIEEPPRRMSFKRIWTTFRMFLLGAMHTTALQWREQYRTALSYATLDKLPNRPDRRYERETYPRRPKSDQFKKRIRRDKRE